LEGEESRWNNREDCIESVEFEDVVELILEIGLAIVVRVKVM